MKYKKIKYHIQEEEFNKNKIIFITLDIDVNELKKFTFCLHFTDQMF